jgi:FkbM family methyltransferase
MNIANIALMISKILQRFPCAHDAARKIYCTFNPGIRFCIEKVFQHSDEIFVLKIGANDGIHNDPLADFMLHDSRFRGVLVEPIPMYAKLLAANYESTGRFKIEQVAITAEPGSKTMYFVNEGSTDHNGNTIPALYRGVASLYRSHVEKHLPPAMRSAIAEVSVECVTVSILLARNSFVRVDLVQIDAEGYDFIVVKQLDFSVIRPKIVIFERKHLSKEDQLAAKEHMTNAGYEVRSQGVDFLCISRISI